MVQTVYGPSRDVRRVRHFAFYHASWMLTLLKLAPGVLKRPGIEVVDQEMRVRISPGGEVVIPRDSITRVRRTWAREQGIAFWLRLPVGIHTNFRGLWWMNWSSRNLVAIDIDPPAGGHMWRIPVRPKRVVVSLEDPEDFIAEVLG